ncbi:tape measure protein [Oceanibacterium hippocampi]|uniref:Tape measure protein N-terminal domain-containing protein n=1 Tax=Oceanibacterium hippocampi TaxID=745714 RepID=A0A1Y5U4Y4_9PROT|nr:tape measure protein [Oceanibacterium hippocampi]SLN77318.1 hypothetical protein OCH7691_04384 [Oceanibacterium hippocampi]
MAVTPEAPIRVGVIKGREALSELAEIGRQGQAHLKSIDAGVGRLEQSMKRTIGQTVGLRTAVTSLGAAFGGFSLVRIGREIRDASDTYSGFIATLTAGTGSAEAANEEYNYLRETVARLGLEIQSAAPGFTKLTSATRGTALAGQATRDIFESVAIAARVLKLDTQQTDGALRALEQIASKGVVSMEELKLQLGDRIPGAMRIASEAMGVSTAQLIKMIESGELLSEDFLPKFAARLKQEFAGALPQAMEAAQASTAALNNALFDLGTNIAASGFIDAYIGSVEALTDVVGFAAAHTDELTNGVIALSTALTASAVPALLSGAGAAAAFTAALLANPIVLAGLAIGGVTFALLELADAHRTAAEEIERADAVQKQMIALREQAAKATGDEAEAIDRKIAALEREEKKQADVLRGHLVSVEAKIAQLRHLAGGEDPGTFVFSDLIRQRTDLQNALNRITGQISEEEQFWRELTAGGSLLGEGAARAADGVRNMTDAEKELNAAIKEGADEILVWTDAFEAALDLENRRLVKQNEVIDGLKTEREELTLSAQEIRIRHALLKAGVERDSEAGKSIVALVKSIDAAKKSSADLDGIVEDANDELARMAAEAEVAGTAILKMQGDQAAFRGARAELEFQNQLLRNRIEGHGELNAALELEREIRERFPAASEEQIQALLAQKRVQGELTDAVAEQERAAQDLARAYDQLARNIQDSLADAFYNVLDDADEGFDEFFDNLVDLAKKAAAQIAAAMVIQPVLGGIGSALGIGGQIAGGGGLLGSLFGGGTTGNAGALDIAKTIGGILPKPFDISGAIGAGGLFAPATATSLGGGFASSAAGGLGVAAVPGGVSNVGYVTGAAGPLAGAAPFLAGAGALAGIASLAFLGYSSVAGNKPIPRAAASVGVGPDGRLLVTDAQTRDKAPQEVADQFGQQLIAVLQGFADATGGTFAPDFDARIGFNAVKKAFDTQIRGVDPADGFLVSENGDAIQKTPMFRELDDALKRIIVDSVENGLISGVDDADIAVLLREGIEEGLRLLQIKSLFRDEVTDPVETTLMDMIEALEPAFEQLVADAKKAGIDLVKVEAALTRDRLNILRQATKEQLEELAASPIRFVADAPARDRLAPLEAEVELARREAIDLINEEILANQALAQEAERARNSLDGIREGLAEFADSLKLSDLSPFTPAEKLAEARSQFDTQLALARGGDVDALAGFTDIAQGFLEASRAFNASSAPFQSDFDLVQAVLEELQTSSVTSKDSQQAFLDEIAAQNQLLVDMAAALSEPEGPNAGLLRDQLAELAGMGVGIDGLSAGIEATLKVQEQVAALLGQINARNQTATEKAAEAAAKRDAKAREDIIPDDIPTTDELVQSHRDLQAIIRDGSFGGTTLFNRNGGAFSNSGTDDPNSLRGFATGGLVPGFGGTDSVIARVTPGEFVMTPGAVNDIGLPALTAMNRGGAFDGLAAELRAMRAEIAALRADNVRLTETVARVGASQIDEMRRGTAVVDDGLGRIADSAERKAPRQRSAG